MKISIKKLPKSEAEVTVGLEREEILKYDEATFHHLAEEIEVPGFRKGKVPKLILLQHLGHEKYNKEFMEKAIPMAFIEAIHQEKLNTISAPDVQLLKFVPGEVLEFKAIVTLMPDVILGDYKAIQVKRNPVVVDEKEVEATIKNLQQKTAAYISKPATEAAGKGDRIEIDFEVSVDGKLLDRGSSKNHPLLIGDNVFIPGFEDQMIGMKPGEEKEFELKFPDEYHEKGIAGKMAKFKVKLNLAQKVELPELNDAFAKRFGNFASIDDLKKSIREGIEMEKKADEEMRLQEEVLKQLADSTKIEVPEILVAQEKEELLKSMEDNLSNSGLRLDQYLATIKKTYDELKADLEKEARRRLVVSLALTKVSQNENIMPTEEEVAREKKHLIEAGNTDDEDATQAATNRVITAKTIKFLVDNATM